MIHMALHVALALIMFAVFPPGASSDMGAIVAVSDVTLKEPGQKAIIAHDGFEEILILGTDMEASSSVKALRFIPLPSEPRVSLAPKNCFDNLGDILKEHHVQYLMQYKSGKVSASSPVELLFHKKIGPHDVTVVRIKDATHFGQWANAYFTQIGLPQKRLTGLEAEIVQDYVTRGFPFFVFDVVELSHETETVRPLLYRFSCTHLYYPLQTSNLFGGHGNIELFVFCDRGEIHRSLRRLTQQDRNESSARRSHFHWTLTSNSAVVTRKEMNSVATEIADLLGDHALLRAFKYEGKLLFHTDVWIHVPVETFAPRPPKLE